MEKENKVDTEKYREYVHNIAIAKLGERLGQVSKRFKSVNRAIRRGLVSENGEIYPKRPFNNRKSTPGRSLNDMKKWIHGKLKERGLQ